MKPCHVAALALVGWYLLNPPVYINTYSGNVTKGFTNINAPLSQWTSSAFGTAAACEAELASRQAIDQQGTAQAKDSVSVALHKSISLMQCVASDDPRLAK